MSLPPFATWHSSMDGCEASPMKIKRLIDILGAAFGLILMSPVAVIIGLVIQRTSAGPVIYRAPRVGRDGNEFRALKFRTMVVNASVIGPAVTGRMDPRVTSAGRILRRSRLDELPQLVNVLRGEMSLVGPRPEAPVYVAMYRPEDHLILTVRPGITGLAQLCFRDEENWLNPQNPATYVVDILPFKLAIDRYYVRHRSNIMDVVILVDTVLALLSRPRLSTRYIEASGVMTALLFKRSN